MALSPADGTVSVLVLRALLVAADFHRIDRQALAAEIGIAPATLDPALLADPDGRVPARAVLRLWEALPKMTGRDDFGLWLAELARAAPLTPSSWLILSSPTLAEGVEQAVRYQRLLHDHASGVVTRNGGGITYLHRVGDGTFRAPRHAIEFGFAQIVYLIRRATGRDVIPVNVRLRHARPQALARHTPLFGAKVEFNATADEISFDRDTSELPVVTADESLRELVSAHAKSLLARLSDSPSVTTQVQRMLAAELPNRALSIDTVAEALAMTKRTLQRRLQEEGTSFEDVVDGLRRNLAELYLREQRFGVQETAFLLGYSDTSAFHKAFLRWTGVSPARYRNEGN